MITDTHIEEGNAFGLERLPDALGNAAFVVVLGDVTQNGTPADIRTFLGIAEACYAQGVPCYPVVGNHDVYRNNWRHWRDLIGSTSYTIDGGDTVLYMLDTANASVGAEQLEYLEGALRQRRSRVFVFTHTNLFTESILDFQALTDIRERARLMALLDGRCDVVFTGHVHRRITKHIEGVQYITIEDFRSTKTYCRVYVSPDGIHWRFSTL